MQEFTLRLEADYVSFFNKIQSEGMKKVVFAGTDEVEEIAGFTLQESQIELSGVVDGDIKGN